MYFSITYAFKTILSLNIVILELQNRLGNFGEAPVSCPCSYRWKWEKDGKWNYSPSWKWNNFENVWDVSKYGNSISLSNYVCIGRRQHPWSINHVWSGEQIVFVCLEDKWTGSASNLYTFNLELFSWKVTSRWVVLEVVVRSSDAWTQFNVHNYYWYSRKWARVNYELQWPQLEEYGRRFLYK